MSEKWFKIIKVHPRVWALAEFRHWEKVISYLLVGEKEAALFDTGMGYADISSAVKKLTKLPLKVFLTHGHWDHIGGTTSFDQIYLYPHQFEIKQLTKGFSSLDIPELNNPVYFEKPFVPLAFSLPGKSQTLPLRDGQVVSCGGYKISVLHTPGHTPGSVCYWVKELNLVFAGDTLYPGPLYAQLPESNLKDYLTSLGKLAQVTDEKTIFFPGHNATIANKKLLSAAQAAFKDVTGDLIRGRPGKGVKEYKFAGFSILTKA